VISSSKRPLPDNTQHTKQTTIHVLWWDFFLYHSWPFWQFLTFLTFYLYEWLTWDRLFYFPFRRKACCEYSHLEKSDGFGRERPRDLGYQRPACKPLDHRSRLIGPATFRFVAQCLNHCATTYPTRTDRAHGNVSASICFDTNWANFNGMNLMFMVPYILVIYIYIYICTGILNIIHSLFNRPAKLYLFPTVCTC
jgi:hypothetical protein